MLRQAIFCVIASASMVPASVASAQHGPGGGGGPPAGVGAGGPPSGMPGSGNAGGFGMGGPMGMGPGMGPGMGMTTRESARINSQGPMHASATGIAHANQNSVLYGTTVVGGPLTGLSVGSTVYDVNGAAVGTVERIVPSSNRFVSNVLVRGSDGRIYPLSPTSLSLSGSLWTTTSLRHRG